MTGGNGEADEMLDVYIYDYLVKRNFQKTAKAFMEGAKVAADPLVIDAPRGFLFEWWSVFWDIYIARTRRHGNNSGPAAAYIETQRAKDQQKLKMQQLQRIQLLQRSNTNCPVLTTDGVNSDGILVPSATSIMAAKICEERLKHPHSMDSEPSPQLLDASRMALHNSATNHPGQLVQGNPGGVSAMQQIQARHQQTNLKMGLMQQPSAQQSQDQLQQQQLQQNNKKMRRPEKKRHLCSSRAANSYATGSTVGPSPNSPSPSIHTAGDGVAMAGNLQHVDRISKGSMMYGADGTGGLASPSAQMDGPAKHNPESSKGSTFNEYGCIRASNNKVVCCHFSSNGKLLASAGHDKKVVLWNMDTLQIDSTPEEHTGRITDVCFRPNSTQLATSSFDGTLRLWNASDLSYCLRTYTGHGSNAASLDFHPERTDIFCSGDSNGEIRFWNVSQDSCFRVSKGGTAQLRFQPRFGQLLAAAGADVVSIFDVEKDTRILTLKGHTNVHSVCWDASGQYLASGDKDSVKLWSLESGECINDIGSTSEDEFHSCIFHPSYPNILVIGGSQSLWLWNMAENKVMTVRAHKDPIAGLAQSADIGMVASASHDGTVKLWK